MVASFPFARRFKKKKAPKPEKPKIKKKAMLAKAREIGPEVERKLIRLSESNSRGILFKANLDKVVAQIKGAPDQPRGFFALDFSPFKKLLQRIEKGTVPFELFLEGINDGLSSIGEKPIDMDALKMFVLWKTWGK